MSQITKLITSAVIVCLVGLGIYDYIKLNEENACEMTWMFQYPKYMKIQVDKDTDKLYHKYGLYIYGEGSYAQEISKLKLNGVPVLFIPGNAGSYRQVRSLGSVSLRKSENIGDTIQFNYFSIDFNEEFSGFYGGVLQDETEYAALCIKKIISFYKSAKTPPVSVIIVGHSMGGLIARALFTLPGFDSHLVSTIITQATPHQAPVLNIEKGLLDFYSNVNYYWEENAYTTLDHVTVVSTGGGYRDILVRNGLTSLNGVVRQDRHIATCTMSIPKAFVSTDHLCAVWCRQIVLVTTRALFDVIDPKSKQVMTNPDERLRIFKHHYITNPGSPYASKAEEITLDDNISWEEKSETVWRFVQPKVVSAKYFAIPLAEEEENSLVVIANITHDNWICTCNVPQGQKRCKSCMDISDKVRLLPSKHQNKRVLRTSLENLDESATHIVIILKPTRHRVDITVELYNSIRRHLMYTLPGFYDTVISYPIAVMDASVMLQIHNKTVFYSLHLSGMDSPLKVYTAEIIPKKCQKTDSGDEGSVFSLNIPWANESVYTYTDYNEKGVFDVKLQSGRPVDFNGGAVHLHMYLHPSCYYQLRLKLSTVDTLGQIVRFYGVLFPAAFIAIILLSFGFILCDKSDEKESLVPQDILWTSSKPYIFIPIIGFVIYVLSVPKVEEFLRGAGLPFNDSYLLSEKSIWSPLILPILYTLAFGTTYFHTTVVYYFFAGVVKIVSKLFHWIPGFVFTFGFYLQTLIGLFAILLCFMYCGTAGLTIIYFFIIIKVMRFYHLSNLSQKKEDKIHFNLLFFLLLLILWNILLNLPFMVVWLQNLSFSLSLKSDPSCIPCGILSVTSLILISLKPNYQKSSFNDVLGWMYYLAAVVVMLYSLESVYRIPLISATMLTVLSLYRIQQIIR